MQQGNAAILSSFLGSIVSAGQLDTSGQCTINCYKGVIPTDTEVLTYTAASRASDLLAQFTNMTFQVVGNALVLNVAPASVYPTAAGTIGWAAICGQNNCNILVQPSVAGGTGALILSSLTTAVSTLLSVDSSGSGVSILFYQ